MSRNINPHATVDPECLTPAPEPHGRHSAHFSASSLASQASATVGVDSARCYQCGKCSAGCPLADEMDFTSSAVLRMLQTEDPAADRELLTSQTIWLCASCEMCISRCPMQVDIPKLMDFLRQRSLYEGLANRDARRNIVAFHRSFLDVIRLTGRSYEIGLVVDYKVRSGKLLQDLTVAPAMFLKGKLALIPEMVRDRRGIKRIFKKTDE
ncbi:MAG: 4Fe-4S dicluster domain-containing protein [Rikenellaceae bacterium]|nr:4Fe-4S dicluster domain-containing protein [Rikenellaceae bacterium]